MNEKDKRTVTTDALETLGSIITPNEKRDAIHLAVENVVAAHLLRAGEDIGFLPDGTVSSSSESLVGIVDPFLKAPVKKGERCWLVVYPRQITSLRHVWTHPSFPENEPEVVEVKLPPLPLSAFRQSEEWLNGYADSIPVSLGELIEHARRYVDYEEYWVQGGRFEGESVPSEFWDHYETYTGRAVSSHSRSNFFSCSC